MAIEVRLFGFGSEKPPGFGAGNRRRLELATPATPQSVLDAAGIETGQGLLLMRANEVIPADRWQQPLVADGDRLTLMFAIEGG